MCEWSVGFCLCKIISYIICRVHWTSWVILDRINIVTLLLLKLFSEYYKRYSSYLQDFEFDLKEVIKVRRHFYFISKVCVITKEWDMYPFVIDWLIDLLFDLYSVLCILCCISDKQLVPAAEKTRGHSLKFRQIGTRTNFHKHSFYPSLIPWWNSLPESLATANSISTFRSGLQNIQLKLPR